MRFTTTASVAALLTLAAVSQAQDAQCSAVTMDYAPNGNGAYQKCYTNQVYNQGLVSQGGAPNYKELIHQVCSKSACSHSTLTSATSKYITACAASMDAESTASNGNILQIGKSALDIFFAEPIRAAYCAEDPNAVAPPPTVPPTIPPPVYCLEADIANPSTRFVSNLAIYLTSGSIRSSQTPFFSTNNLDPKEICSDCSKLALNATVDYLSKNLMPKIAQFYTPEFVQYWTKFVPEYNTLCKTKFTQTWPEGTLNVTVPNVPTGSPSAPATELPTSATTAAPTPTGANAAGALKPVAGVATALLLAVAAML
ncbi:hypothetical protein BGZ51_002495 [Haplosporangium sp. Z 767]|nr:hypothetical protein BGZ51_002495 [Haplosporangium sp. Z 767]KAF9190882.1 hypothetical protein BGZ50_009760 [Haplosporangium sp. Z 11]